MQNIYPSTSNQYPLNSYQSIPNYTPKSYQSAPLNLPSQAAHSFTALLNDDSNNYMPQVYTPYQTSNQRYHTAESVTGKETQDKPTSKQKGKWFKKEETTLLLTIWDEKFKGFDNKKRIKAEEWADLVKEYNMSASRHGFAIRSHNQIVNRVRNSVDTYKRYKDKHNSTDESSIPADDDTCPDYNILNRVLGGRQSINPQHILDPGKIPLSEVDLNVNANVTYEVDISENENQEDEIIDVVNGDEAVDDSFSPKSNTNSGRPVDENGFEGDESEGEAYVAKVFKTKRKNVAKSPEPPRLAKKKRQRHTKTQKEAADEQDKFLNFLKENQKRDDEIFSKLMEMSRDAERRQNEATNKIIESIGARFKASSKD